MSETKPISRTQIRNRRAQSIALTLGILSVLAVVLYQMNQNLHHSSYLSGYILLGSILFLAAFNVRKKLTFLPSIGSAASWMQFHIYVGLSTFLIFGFHIAWKMPSGWFECFLALLYLVVASSGVYGLMITRVIPKRLTAIGDEVIFERIPALRNQLARQARQLALGCAESSEVIPGYYLKQLLPFFEKRRSLAYLAFPNGRRKRQLVNEIGGLQRYLSQEHRRTSETLREFVKKKDDLDYHYALQSRLKIWMFLHVGFTYSLVVIGVLHGIMVHAFIGGLP